MLDSKATREIMTVLVFLAGASFLLYRATVHIPERVSDDIAVTTSSPLMYIQPRPVRLVANPVLRIPAYVQNWPDYAY